MNQILPRFAIRQSVNETVLIESLFCYGTRGRYAVVQGLVICYDVNDMRGSGGALSVPPPHISFLSRPPRCLRHVTLSLTPHCGPLA